MALQIEKGITDLVKLFLHIETEKKRALTNKSGGLSFKNKIDILFDIEIIDESEHVLLLLLMEYRNQFMHNYECNSFAEASAVLGADKKNRLWKFADPGATESEESFKNAFSNVYGAALGMLLKKLDLKKRSITENHRYLLGLNEKLVLLFDKYFDLYDLTLNLIEPAFTDSNELLDFKMDMFAKLQAIVDKDLNVQPFTETDVFKSEEFQAKIIERHLKWFKKQRQ
jgi:hypothetical protein